MDLRFSSALQVLLSLALAEEQGVVPLPSSQLANGLGVPSSVVRRLAAPLIEAGLIASSMGKSGGLRLAKPAEQIRLVHLYDAVQVDAPLWGQRKDLVHQCLVTTHIENYVGELDAEARAVVRNLLGGKTLMDSLARLKKLDARKAGGRRS
jgi:Rrf2 family transcriptional repressor of oqxAB